MNKLIKYILLTALFLRVFALLALLFLHIDPLERITSGSDSIGYEQLARNLIDQNGYKFLEGSNTAFRMPGYPLLMAGSILISQGWIPIWILQTIMDLISVGLVYKISLAITKKTHLAIFAAILMMANPLLIVSSISLLPETIVVSLVTIGLFLLIQYPGSTKSKILLPILFGLCIYLKPTFFIIAIVLFLAISIFKYKQSNSILPEIKSFLFSMSIIILMILPWVIRNNFVMKSFILLTTSNGVNFYGGNNPSADGGFVSNDPYVLSGIGEVASDSIFTKRGLDWIQSNFIDFLKLLPQKASRFFWPLSFGTSGNLSLPLFAFAIILLAMLVYYSFVMVGWVELILQKSYWRAIALIIIPVCLLLETLLTFGSARFALPAVPAFAILFSIGIGKISSVLFRQLAPGKI